MAHLELGQILAVAGGHIDLSGSHTQGVGLVVGDVTTFFKIFLGSTLFLANT